MWEKVGRRGHVLISFKNVCSEGEGEREEGNVWGREFGFGFKLRKIWMWSDILRKAKLKTEGRTGILEGQDPYGNGRADPKGHSARLTLAERLCFL